MRWPRANCAERAHARATRTRAPQGCSSNKSSRGWVGNAIVGLFAGALRRGTHYDGVGAGWGVRGLGAGMTVTPLREARGWAPAAAPLGRRGPAPLLLAARLAARRRKSGRKDKKDGRRPTCVDVEDPPQKFVVFPNPFPRRCRVFKSALWAWRQAQVGSRARAQSPSPPRTAPCQAQSSCKTGGGRSATAGKRRRSPRTHHPPPPRPRW